MCRLIHGSCRTIFIHIRTSFFLNLQFSYPEKLRVHCAPLIPLQCARYKMLNSTDILHEPFNSNKNLLKNWKSFNFKENSGISIQSPLSFKIVKKFLKKGPQFLKNSGILNLNFTNMVSMKIKVKYSCQLPHVVFIMNPTINSWNFKKHSKSHISFRVFGNSTR